MLHYQTILSRVLDSVSGLSTLLLWCLCSNATLHQPWRDDNMSLCPLHHFLLLSPSPCPWSPNSFHKSLFYMTLKLICLSQNQKLIDSFIVLELKLKLKWEKLTPGWCCGIMIQKQHALLLTQVYFNVFGKYLQFFYI